MLLDALRDGPKHGYEIIKSLEERSSGQYAPSPGTVYPTMQYLEDLGQVRSDQDAERRVYHLTEAGRAELEARAEDLSAFWARFGGADSTPPASRRSASCRKNWTTWRGRSGTACGPTASKARPVREAVERCRSEVRGILAGNSCGRDSAGILPE